VRLSVALEEGLMNAIIHGNLEVSSKLREQADGAYERLIERRRRQHRFAVRRARITCQIDRTAARIVIRDEGPGFDVTSLPDPRDPERLALASGRGILLMRTFMDEVTYNGAGNEVTLVKRRVPEPPSEVAAPPLLAACGMA
jgi:anti-sigma regulatory factor (Ser/Thr protein kinase)